MQAQKEDTMVPISKAFPSEPEARQAMQQLRHAGVPGDAIRLLRPCRFHDVRDEPVGTFAGSAGPDAPIGTYAGIRPSRRQGAGTFAGNPDRQRQGSFADADRDLGAAVYHEHAAKMVDHLYSAHWVVLVDVQNGFPATVAQALFARRERPA
jgi:hypothetical protein